MVHTIRNDRLTVSADSYGAELCAVTGPGGVRYLYEGDSPFWPAKAPVLFPIVGKLKNGTYRHAGRTYEMGGHGFARRSEFEVTASGPDFLVFTLTDNPETEKMYPFRFRFDVTYRLEKDILSAEFAVSNRSDGPMYFSVGAHEGYNCPLVPGESFTDYDILFEQEENIGSRCIDPPTGLRTGETYPLLENSRVLPLRHDYFDTDAIVLLGLRSRKVCLKSRRGGRGVEVGFPGFSMLGIWQKPGAPYVCIEPWAGVCDTQDFDGELCEKDGIVKLEKDEMYRVVHTVRPF